jgi:hypothetical protein
MPDQQKQDNKQDKGGWNTNDHFIEGVGLGALLMFIYMKFFQK